jgi:hypothetical protein
MASQREMIGFAMAILVPAAMAPGLEHFDVQEKTEPGD